MNVSVPLVWLELVKLTLLVVNWPHGPDKYHAFVPQSIRPVGYCPFSKRFGLGKSSKTIVCGPGSGVGVAVDVRVGVAVGPPAVGVAVGVGVGVGVGVPPAAVIVTVTRVDGVSMLALSSVARLTRVIVPVVVGVQLKLHEIVPVTGCHVVPPSTDSSTPPTTPPVSEAVPLMVTGTLTASVVP